MKLNQHAFGLVTALSGFVIPLHATTLDPHGPYYGSPNGGNPLLSGQELIASGGDVTVTFLGPTTAIYDDIIFLQSPANGFGLFFDNHSTYNGTSIDLGSYAAGTELEFGLYVFNTGNTWYDGPGSRNIDGQVHTYMLNNYEGIPDTTYIGFEDLAANAGADWNYVDDIYAVSGVNAMDVPVPDIASTAFMLGFAGLSLSIFRKSFRNT
jgi:hypothetical protein